MSEEQSPTEGEPENYVPPPQKSINEILAQDQDDAALQRYKEKLLGAATENTVIVGEQIRKDFIEGT